MARRAAVFSLLSLLVGGSATAAAPLTDYALLLNWRYNAEPVAVPAAGVSFRRDTAVWQLLRGEVRFAEPTADGTVTGALFEGEGRFSISVPDPREAAQLGRFTDGKPLTEVAFRRLIVRAPAGVPAWLGLPSPAPGARFTPQSVTTSRHQHWLEERWFDVDARVLGARGFPGDDYLRVEFETKEWGWLTYEMEPLNREEIHLLHREQGRTEVWLSLDRPEDRTAEGFPGRQRRDHLRLDHADLRIDLQEAGRESRQGDAAIQPRRAKITAALRFAVRQPGARALFFELAPDAQVTAVRRGGRALEFIRHAIGARRAGLDNRLYDASLLVWLDEPLATAAPFELEVDYEVEVLNYVQGRLWFPQEAGDRSDEPHTATLEFVLPAKLELVAMGERTVQESSAPGTRREVWRVSPPVTATTFTFAERALEETVQVPGAPPVRVFALGGGSSARERLRDVGEDVATAVAFYSDLFAQPLDAGHLVVTSIVSGHGQAFQGFLHLAEGTFEAGDGPAGTRFRAHEAAHQWWGHRVSPAGYRDDWLAESLAEYSALMFLEHTQVAGGELLAEALAVYNDELTGSIGSAMSRFGRGNTVLNDRDRGQVGPLALGARAATARVPQGGALVLYQKGPLMVHMLRHWLAADDAARGAAPDTAFRNLLRGFLARHDGGTVTGEDFVTAVLEQVGETRAADYQRFFDQWLYGTAVPTIRWKTEVRGNQLRLTVRQTDVPAGFVSLLPVRLQLEEGHQTFTLRLDQPEKSFDIPLEGPLRQVLMNHGAGTLARVVRD